MKVPAYLILLLSTSHLIVISISYCLTGLQHEGIFRVSGSQVEVNDIKNAFERGKEDLFSISEIIAKCINLFKYSEKACFECNLLYFVPFDFCAS